MGFWCLFMQTCNTHQGLTGDVEPGEELEVLGAFCGFPLEDDNAFDCSCCSDHYLSEPGMRASVMYAGGPDDTENDFAPAFLRDTNGKVTQKGKVRTWSLGGHVTSLWCESSGRPVCRCEDPIDLWHEEEPGCRLSDLCAPPDPPVEGVSGWSPLDRKGEKSSKGSDLPNCLGDDQQTPRVSIGDARCEDMS